MKTLILFFLAIPFISFSQECSRVDKILSIQGGSPTNVGVEFTVQSESFGLSAGVNGHLINLPGTEVVKPSQTMNVSPYLKGTFKAYGGEDDDFRVYGLAYYGIGIWGAGIRIGYILDDNTMLMLEPTYGYSKLQVNIGVGFRL
jgi:hypothetical protein